MTWTKLSDDFADQCDVAGLSDAAFRTHVEALILTMRRETDGKITRRELRKHAAVDDYEAAAAELVAAGFWRTTDDGWQVIHHMEHQPESEVIAKRRAMDAERQRKARMRKAGIESADDEAAKTRKPKNSDSAAESRPPVAAFPPRPDPSRPDPSHAYGHAVTEGGRHTVTDQQVAEIVGAQEGDFCLFCKAPVGGGCGCGGHPVLERSKTGVVR